MITYVLKQKSLIENIDLVFQDVKPAGKSESQNFLSNKGIDEKIGLII
jgi:hypothetical protein